MGRGDGEGTGQDDAAGRGAGSACLSSLLSGPGKKTPLSPVSPQDANSRSNLARVALCLADAVTLVELPAPPPVSLAVALGALSADERGAAARALGRAAAATAAAPPRAGVATLELEALLASAGGHVPVAGR